MNNLITSPFNSINDNPASHRSAQGVIYADQIRQKYGNCTINYGGTTITDHNAFDNLWVYHGNDFSGGLNLFGGVYGFGGVDNIVNFSKFKGQVYSIGIPFPAYHEMIESKLKSAEGKDRQIQPEWYDIALNNLKSMHINAKTIKYPNCTKKLVVGDSHSICMYRPGWTVNSIPFKTLNGVLNDGIKSYIDVEYDELELYFGNIDIRHHILRLNIDINHLADRYIEQASALGARIYELLPIEHVSRKLPKSGYYKGQPFYGSWQERTDARNQFNDYIEKNYGIIRWTKKLVNIFNELDFAYMEKPRSIHLSRQYYPHWKG